MNLLALDTSTHVCAVALLYEGKIYSSIRIAAREHAQCILDMIDQLLKKAGTVLSALDALVFGEGPGSFTGVRIAASVTQGLALGANLPVIPVSSLQALAQTVLKSVGPCTVLAMIDARMNEVYEQTFARDADDMMWPISELKLSRPEEVNTQDVSCIVGSGLQAYSQRLSLKDSIKLYPDVMLDAESLLEIGKVLFKQKRFISASEIKPHYVRNTVVQPV